MSFAEARCEDVAKNHVDFGEDSEAEAIALGHAGRRRGSR